MKSIFLVTLIFLASNWPKSSVCTAVETVQQEVVPDASSINAKETVENLAAQKYEQKTGQLEEQQTQAEAPVVAHMISPVKEGFVRKLNWKTPGQRMMEAQRQHQQQLQQQQEQVQNQFKATENENVDEFRFQKAKPDLVNTVGLDTVKKEAVKVLSQRKENQEREQLLSSQRSYQNFPPQYKNYNNYNRPTEYKPVDRKPENNYNRPIEYKSADRKSENNYNNQNDQYRSDNRDKERDSDREAKKLLKGFDVLGNGKKTFSSLIVIANTNANANLGVTSLSYDLLKSFLSQFYFGKSVEYVLKHEKLDEYIVNFNQQYSRYSSDKPYETSSKLSANVPTYSNAGSKDEKSHSANSHSESTLVLEKTEKTAENTKNLNYAPYNTPLYNYVPHQDGGVIVVNNVNENINENIKRVLGGEGYNVGEYSSGLVLPLSKEEIERLMDNAIIINNDNRNKNHY